MGLAWNTDFFPTLGQKKIAIAPLGHKKFAIVSSRAYNSILYRVSIPVETENQNRPLGWYAFMWLMYYKLYA